VLTADRNYFREIPAIFVPARGQHRAVWANPDDCLWEAPADFETKNPLESIYKENVFRSDTNAAVLQQFFRRTLKILNI
jgi:hypothetical protein